MLVESGAISTEALDLALRQQASEAPRRPLGQILVANGALSDDVMYAALQQQIERTIYELVTWTSGTFEFALDDLREASVAVAAIEQLRRARPRAMIVAVVADSASTSAAFGAGAMAVVPADATVIASCFRSLVQARKDLATGGAARTDRVHAN